MLRVKGRMKRSGPRIHRVQVFTVYGTSNPSAVESLGLFLGTLHAELCSKRYNESL